MSEQPTALRLADALQQQAVWEGHYGPSYLRDLLPQAAAELRRLHAVNQELLEALKYHQEQTRPIERTRAAIKKAEGEV
jgi:hypothetical protein